MYSSSFISMDICWMMYTGVEMESISLFIIRNTDRSALWYEKHEIEQYMRMGITVSFSEK